MFIGWGYGIKFDISRRIVVDINLAMVRNFNDKSNEQMFAKGGLYFGYKF
ncbi:hypothetical protein AB4865_00200 [Capnocytophaga sp. ARDL2]